MRAVRIFFALALGAALLPAAKTLDIYFIDVEGGQSTLVVSPNGQAMLIDAGYTGFSGRDADRIWEAAKAAHVKHVEFLLATHYHSDHIGGVPNVTQRLTFGAFLDHGASIEESNRDFRAYEATVAKGTRKTVKPGDTIPLKGLEITVLTAAGQTIARGGDANPFCEGIAPKPADDALEKTENSQSVGVVVQYGKFRFLDLGDLTWNKELALLCPQNRVGKVDLYLTTHHGAESSKAIYALAPRVAIMNNGPKKGGPPEGWRVIKALPGLEDLWQLHFAVAGGKEANVPDTFIGNIEDPCEGKYIKVSASGDGSFTVYNSRNKYSKSYAAR